MWKKLIYEDKHDGLFMLLFMFNDQNRVSLEAIQSLGHIIQH